MNDDINQIEIFNNVKEVNDWMKRYGKLYEIVDIKFQMVDTKFLNDSGVRFMVWYRA